MGREWGRVSIPHPGGGRQAAKPLGLDTGADDDRFSHLRAPLAGPNITVSVHCGEPVPGTGQQIVVICHGNHPRQREVFVPVVGE